MNSVAELLAFIIERRKALGYFRPVKVQVPKHILEQIKLWYENPDRSPTDRLTD